jgi:pSer/pThr/pTyr-binding forkhead associated (FHA) protein
MWLTVFAGPAPAHTVEVSGSRFLIGRDESCDLVIDDPKVSREHAVIVPASGPLRMIRDLGSANGILIDGRRLQGPVSFSTAPAKETQLSGGEWLHFGDTGVMVTLMDPRQTPPQGMTPPHRAAGHRPPL